MPGENRGPLLRFAHLFNSLSLSLSVRPAPSLLIFVLFEFVLVICGYCVCVWWGGMGLRNACNCMWRIIFTYAAASTCLYLQHNSCFVETYLCTSGLMCVYKQGSSGTLWERSTHTHTHARTHALTHAM
eukprot:Rmarinus@m.27632